MCFSHNAREQERGRLALLGAAAVNELPVFNGPMTYKTFQQTEPPPIHAAQSPYSVSPTASARLITADSHYIEVPGVIHGTLPHQAVGYGRYSVS